MADIRLVPRIYELPPVSVTFDWLLTDAGVFDDRDELATAVIIAIGTDRAAYADDILPEIGETDRRGWWADYQAEEIWDGWPIGSRLWLLARAKITGFDADQGSTVARAYDYIAEALQPFVDRRIVSAYDINVTRVETNQIDAQIVLYRGNKPLIALRYSTLWDDIERNAQAPALPNWAGV
jgi:phage gp46-like protein